MNQQEALDLSAVRYKNQQLEYLRNQGMTMLYALNAHGSTALTNLTPSPMQKRRNEAHKYAAEVRARNPSMQVKRRVVA